MLFITLWLVIDSVVRLLYILFIAITFFFRTSTPQSVLKKEISKLVNTETKKNPKKNQFPIEKFQMIADNSILKFSFLFAFWLIDKDNQSKTQIIMLMKIYSYSCSSWFIIQEGKKKQFSFQIIIGNVYYFILMIIWIWFLFTIFMITSFNGNHL